MTASKSIEPAALATISWVDRPDGGRLRIWHWKAATARRGTVLVLPSYYEYGAYHGVYAAQLALAGFHVHVMDQRGYGSIHPGDSIATAEPLLDDATFMLESLRGPAGELPILIGSSIGALVALELCRNAASRFRALVVSSPAIQLKFSDDSFELGMQLLAQQHPGIQLPRRWPDPVHNPAVLKAWREDPQAIKTLTVGQAFAHLDLQRRVSRSTVRPRVPVLVIEGGADLFSDTAVSARYWSRMRRAGVALEHHLVPDANVSVHTEAPETFARYVREFLLGLPG